MSNGRTIRVTLHPFQESEPEMWLSELKSGVSVEQIEDKRKRNGCLTFNQECGKKLICFAGEL
jgi:hypothetical protein